MYVDMVADLFHAGHVRFLRQARELGEQRAAAGVHLLVGLHSDDATASYKRRPIQTLAERHIVIAACRYVDEVVLEAPIAVDAAFLAEHEVDLVVHGDDMDTATLRYWYAVPIDLGRFATVPYTPGVSTSALLQRMSDRFAEAGGADVEAGERGQ